MNEFIQKGFGLVRQPTVRNTILSLGGDGFFTISTFFATILIARGLPVDQFGIFIVLVTVLVLVNDMADVGVGSALSHFIPSSRVAGDHKRVHQFIKAAYLFEFIVGLILVGIGYIAGGFISHVLFKSSSYGSMVFLTSIAGACSLLVMLTAFTLTALERFHHKVIVNNIPPLIRLAGYLFMFITHSMSLYSVIVLHLISFLPGLFVGLFFLGNDWMHAKFSKSILIELLHFSKYLGLSKGVAAISSRLDVLMLSSLVGPAEAGIYGAASRMTLVYPLLSGSLSSVLAPRFAHLKTTDETKEFLKKTFLSSIGIGSSAIVLILFAPVLVPIIFSAKYMSAISVFQLLLIPNVLFILTIPTVTYVIYKLKKPHIVTITSVVQLLIIAISNIVLIPLLGRFGPIPGLTLAFLQVLVVTGYITIHSIKGNHE